MSESDIQNVAKQIGTPSRDRRILAEKKLLNPSRQYESVVLQKALLTRCRKLRLERSDRGARDPACLVIRAVGAGDELLELLVAREPGLQVVPRDATQTTNGAD